MNKKLTIQLLQILCLVIAVSCSDSTTYNKNKRILEETTTTDNCLYVLFDAGSSSTKVRIYQWPCRKYETIPDIKLIAPISDEPGFKLTPKINDVAKSVNDYKKYFQPAFDAIQKKLTTLKLENTKPFIFLRATAGLRLLSADEQELILSLVRGVFSNESNYHFLDDQWARVITGQQEGSFLWMSVNYALKNITPGNKLPVDLSKFAAVIDIGGASAQTAFVSEKARNTFLDLPERNRFSLYSTSLLGYGNDEARKKVVKLNPTNIACFQKFTDDADYSVDVGSNGVSDIKKFKGKFNEDECINQILNSIFDVDQCTYPLQGDKKDCSSESGLQKITSQDTIFGVSSIFYSKLNLGNAISGDKINIKEFRNKAIEYCKKDNSAKPSDSDANKFKCFQMMLTTTFMIDGLGLGDKQVTAVDKLNDFALDWSIGSLIYDLNTLQCDYLDISVCGQLENTKKNVDEVIKKDEQSNSDNENNVSFSCILQSQIILIILIVSYLF